MGALTDNRKRRFVDLFCFPSPSSSFSPCCLPAASSPHRGGELSPDFPIVKKPKISPPPPPPAPPPPPPLIPPIPLTQLPPQALTKPRCFPPPAPLPRPIHAPQRILKVFGLGGFSSTVGSYRRSSLPESVSGWEQQDAGMGNLVSRSIKRKASDLLWSWNKDENMPLQTEADLRWNDDESSGGLKLDDYKWLVKGSREEGHSPVLEHRHTLTANGKVAFPRSVSSPASDLTVLTREEKDTPESHVLCRKVGDARRLVRLESTATREEVAWENRNPLYKDLLEATARKYDSRRRELDFELKLAEKKISGLRIATKIKPKKEVPEPFVALTDEEENEVDLALREPDRSHLRRHEVLVVHESSNIEITREVMQCLRQTAWLNDEVINLYLELLKEREKRDPKKFLRCHFFNTFFYKKLTSGREGYDFKAIKRWTTLRKIGYGLIECDKIFVPIHKEIHWCLAVIDVKDEKFLYLDSLGGMDHRVLNILARYLMDEIKDKINKMIDVTTWKQESVDDLPMQHNGYDCGMFMLKYADFYSRGLHLTFGQEHMSYFRRRTVKEILMLRAD